MPTALDNGRRSPKKLFRAVVARLLGAEAFRETRPVANPSHVRRKDGPLTPSFTGPPFNLSRSAVTRSDAGVTSSLDNSRRRSRASSYAPSVARLLGGSRSPGSFARYRL